MGGALLMGERWEPFSVRAEIGERGEGDICWMEGELDRESRRVRLTFTAELLTSVEPATFGRLLSQVPMLLGLVDLEAL